MSNIIIDQEPCSLSSLPKVNTVQESHDQQLNTLPRSSNDQKTHPLSSSPEISHDLECQSLASIDKIDTNQERFLRLEADSTDHEQMAVGLTVNTSADCNPQRLDTTSEIAEKLPLGSVIESTAMKSSSLGSMIKANPAQESSSLGPMTIQQESCSAVATKSPQLCNYAAEINESKKIRIVFGERSETLPFRIVLEQRISGIGLILGESSTGSAYIKHLVSFGPAAKDGTLR